MEVFAAWAGFPRSLALRIWDAMESTSASFVSAFASAGSQPVSGWGITRSVELCCHSSDSSPLPRRSFTSLTRSCQPGKPYSRARTSWASRCVNGSSAAGQFLRLLAKGIQGKDEQEVSIWSRQSPFMGACDPLIQAERRFNDGV